MQAHRFFRSLEWLGFLSLFAAVGGVGTGTALAIDVPNTQPAAFDQPQVNAVLLHAGTLNPYNFEGDFVATGFLDTGSSGVVIDSATVDLINLPKAPGVTFSDIAIGGNTLFNVSQPIDVRLAPSSDPNADDVTKIQTVYNQAYGGVRAQLGPTNIAVDPLADPLRVFGMPVMTGKTVVMDPKPLNDPLGLGFSMHTFIYNQNTPFSPATADTNPGIPPTNLHVALSYASFDRFTQTSPSGALPPTTAHNPFIGPNPLDQLGAAARAVPLNGTSPPPVSVDFQGLHAQGSFLLDTGAAASFISTNLAAQLNVRYVPGTLGSQNPQLETFNPANPAAAGTLIPNQFQLPIQGIGGIETLPGFFLDDLILHTVEGGLADGHPNNLRFQGAPVLVEDVTAIDPLTSQSVTLDGIFGMNFLVLSVSLDLGAASNNPFNWITFDEPNGILGLDMANITVPEPGSVVLAGLGAVLLTAGAWRRRRAQVARAHAIVPDAIAG
jgi:hypothetical protein